MTDKEGHWQVLFVRPWGARYPASAQIAAGEKHGCDRTFSDRAAMISSLRKTDRVCVLHFHLLADPKRKYRRVDLLAALHQIEDKHATVVELSTGRTTATKRIRDTMVVEATEALGAGRVLGKNSKPGRPKRKPLSEEDDKTVRGIWFSALYRTDADAERAINKAGVTITASVIRKIIGNSGRPFGKSVKK